MTQNKLGADAIEITTKIKVFSVVRLSPFLKSICHQLLAHTIYGAFNGSTHEAQAVWITLCMQAEGEPKELYDSHYLPHYVCKDNGFSLEIYTFAPKK
jgi:hypothetical protein